MMAAASAAGSDAVDSSVYTRPIPFKLVKGHGVPVCEAYLRVLNKARFAVSPFCGRPDPDSEPGFEHLERRYLTASEIEPLFNHVHAFMNFGDQDHVENAYHPGAQPDHGYWDTNLENVKGLAFALNQRYLRVWTFQDTVDIDNDGRPDQVLLWQGYGAADNFGPCGIAFSPHRDWIVLYTPQRAFILSADPHRINEGKTRSIFGDPQGSSKNAVQSAVFEKHNPFDPLAGSIDIFKYRGLYYIDVEDLPALETSPEHLEVLLRDHARAEKVCELQTVEKALSK